jgi:pilus assembly protein Flp/PilA
MSIVPRIPRLAERLLREESGQDLIEYALLASFIAMASFASLSLLGPVLAGFYSTLGSLFASF